MIWRALAIVLAVVATTALIPALRHLRETHAPPPPVVRGTFSAPPNAFLRSEGDGFDGALSSDGGQIVFTAVAGGVAQLWHQRLDDDRATALPGTEAASLPTWKPGNRVVAFFANGYLKQFSFEDRAVRILASANAPAGAAWRNDGTLLFAPESRGPLKLMRDGAIEDVTQLRESDRAHLFPSVVGDGFLYVAERQDGSRVIRHITADGESELARTSSHAALLDDALVYVRDGVLVAQRFDGERRVLAGRPAVLAANVGVSRTGHGFFAAAPDVLVSAPPASGDREIAWLDDSGSRMPVMEPADYWQLRLSPDDRHVAVTAVDPLLRSLDVFVVPVARPVERLKISLSLGPDMDPVWAAPEGANLMYRSQQSGASQLMSRLIAPGTAPPELAVPGSTRGDVPSDWRRDTLLVHATHPDTRLDIHAITAGRRRQVTTGAFNEWDGRFSPDGRWIAYVSDESGQPEVYVEAWPGGGQRVRVTSAGGRRPEWANRQFALLFLRGESILSAAAQPEGNRLTFGTPEVRASARGLLDYAVSSADRLLVLSAAGNRQAVPAQLTVHWRTLLPPPQGR